MRRFAIPCLVISVLIGDVLCETKRTQCNPFKLRDLFKTELVVREILEKLRDEATLEGVVKDKVDRFLSMHDNVMRSLATVGVEDKDQLSEMEGEGDEIVMDLLVGNIVHVYSLIRRCLHYVDFIYEHVKKAAEETEHEVLSSTLMWIESLREMHFWPDEEDLKIATVSIARTQYTYQLNIMELINGTIGDRQTEARLTADDCLKIAFSRLMRDPPFGHLQGNPEYAIAIEWLEAGMKLLSGGREEGVVSVEDSHTVKGIVQNLMAARQHHDSHFIAPSPGDGPSTYPNEFFFIRPLGEGLLTTGESLRREEREAFKSRRPGPPDDFLGFEFSPRDFDALCRGETLDIPSIDRTKLKCYFDNRQDSFHKIQPFKIEMAGGVKPQTVEIVHDLLTDLEVSIFRESAIQQYEDLEMSLVRDGKLSGSRTQVSSWVHDTMHPKLQTLTARISALTGLDADWPQEEERIDEYSEAYQVGVYSPGGVHIAHNDQMKKKPGLEAPSETKIWRIATVMFYLNDGVGGRTAFPNAGVGAPVEKGSGVFWFSLRTDGVIDDEHGWHGGCPVLYGTKWVVNKWIKQPAQAFRRPCELEQPL